MDQFMYVELQVPIMVVGGEEFCLLELKKQNLIWHTNAVDLSSTCKVNNFFFINDYMSKYKPTR
jgi:hypothetical protein